MTEIIPEIQLSNGKFYNFETPDPSVLDLETIAHSLSMMCRFSGHTRRHYSVAEHCVRASYIGPDDEALERLFHDAAECLVVDLPSPIKVQDGMEKYRSMDHDAEAVVAKRFNLTYPWPASVKVADLVMLATERRDLMPDAVGGSNAWVWLKVEPLNEHIGQDRGVPLSWKQAFISRANELFAARERRAAA